MPSFTVKRVESADDRAEVRRIRREVFVVEQQVPETLEWEYEDESVSYLARDADGVPVACGRWRPTREGRKIERMAVLKPGRGRGAGAAVLAALLGELAAKRGLVYLNAQESAVRFYQRHGFVVVGERFEEAGIGHYRMEYDPEEAIG